MMHKKGTTGCVNVEFNSAHWKEAEELTISDI